MDDCSDANGYILLIFLFISILMHVTMNNPATVALLIVSVISIVIFLIIYFVGDNNGGCLYGVTPTVNEYYNDYPIRRDRKKITEPSVDYLANKYDLDDLVASATHSDSVRTKYNTHHNNTSPFFKHKKIVKELMSAREDAMFKSPWFQAD